MNFLAHAYLAGLDDPEFFTGNLMADFIRGRLRDDYPPRIVHGIRLHRRVDSYTDSHPFFLQSRDRVKPVWGRYSPILIDMFYDHFLAADWDQYSDDSLSVFTARSYEVLKAHQDLMPELMQRAVAHMIEHDWFNSYQSIDGIGTALGRMSKRIPARRQVHLEQAVEELRVHYEDLRTDFHSFMPKLILEVNKWKDVHLI